MVDSNAPHTLFDVPLRDEEVYQDQELHLDLIDDLNMGLPSLARGDVPLEVVDESKIGDNSSKKLTQNMHLIDEGFIDDDYDDDDDNNDDDDGDEDDEDDDDDNDDDIDPTGLEYSKNEEPSEDDCSDWEYFYQSRNFVAPAAPKEPKIKPKLDFSSEDWCIGCLKVTLGCKDELEERVVCSLSVIEGGYDSRHALLLINTMLNT
ncbi:hypothetical protein Tco_0481689 [Tanacetum coccineum]